MNHQLVPVNKNTMGVTRPWWHDGNMVSLVRKTAFKDCNQTEFEEAVAVARELELSPLRKQIYAFVFNKEDEARRQMAIVVGIDGARAIAARTGNYRPDDQAPEWVFSEDAVDPLANPLGIVSCTVGVKHRPTKRDKFERIVATVFWDEFAPIRTEAEAYQWVETGQKKPNGQPRMKKVPVAGSEMRRMLDPTKQGWIKSGRHMLAKCAEMLGMRKGWPDNLARVYVQEEIDRAQVIDGEFTDVTASALADQAEASKRLEKLGGPSIVVDACDGSNELIAVPVGKFADWFMAAIEQMDPAAVANFADRNKPGLNEFWAANKTDCLALKKAIEARSQDRPAAATSSQAAKATPVAGDSGLPAAGALLRQIAELDTYAACIAFGNAHREHVLGYPRAEREDLSRALRSRTAYFRRVEETAFV